MVHPVYRALELLSIFKPRATKLSILVVTLLYLFLILSKACKKIIKNYINRGDWKIKDPARLAKKILRN